MWGVTATVLNFIPYLGPLLALTVIGLVAIISFESWTAAVLPPAAFLTLTTIEGQFLTPLALGRRLTLNPAVIFLALRSEEHTSELQSLMRISYAVFCLKKHNTTHQHHINEHTPN